jgi:hypothetical protein
MRESVKIFPDKIGRPITTSSTVIYHFEDNNSISGGQSRPHTAVLGLGENSISTSSVSSIGGGGTDFRKGKGGIKAARPLARGSFGSLEDYNSSSAPESAFKIPYTMSEQGVSSPTTLKSPPSLAALRPISSPQKVHDSGKVGGQLVLL